MVKLVILAKGKEKGTKEGEGIDECGFICSISLQASANSDICCFGKEQCFLELLFILVLSLFFVLLLGI